MKKLPEKTKDLLILSLMAAILVIMFAIVSHMRAPAEEDMAVAVGEFVRLLVHIAIGLLAVIPIGGVIAIILSFLNWKEVLSCLSLTANWLSARIAAKNDTIICPCLQQFLFFVFGQNNEFLHLPLGKDVSSLLSLGRAAAFRKNCVFYRFQMVAPEKPEMDCQLLRLIIQNYITAELENYGISGLASYFQCADVGAIPSVFLDRVFYDEAQHHLIFDVLYVCTGDAAKYVRNAIERDAAPERPEREIFDDDLQ